MTISAPRAPRPDRSDRMAVAIVSYNTREYLRQCLASLEAAGAREIVVVDNGSADGSVEMLRRDFPHVVVHANQTNPGYGAASNEAIAATTAPYVFLLNTDTLVERDALERLTAYLDAHPRVGIAGPRLHNVDGTLQRSAHDFPSAATLRPVIRLIPGVRDRSVLTWPHDRDRRVAWVKGAALAIRREAFDAVNGFDPSFFLYFEETDLCLRMAQVGWETHFTPTTVVIHKGGRRRISSAPRWRSSSTRACGSSSGDTIPSPAHGGWTRCSRRARS